VTESPVTAAAPWPMPPLLRASAVLHLCAIVLTLIRPHWWPWTLSAVVINHLQLAAIGLWPRSRALGRNWTRLPPTSAARGEVAITIDDGPHPDVTPQVLEMLARHQARVTFFCIGKRAEQYPHCVRAALAAGHAIENHSYRHRHNFSLLGPGAMRREIELGQQALTRVCGVTPRFFRAPAGLRNPFLDFVLHRLRLQLHDGHAARGGDGRAVILDVLPRLLQRLEQQGLTAVSLVEAMRVE
jgi:peptidoglycan-N-acetylglucosamine deacetylase